MPNNIQEFKIPTKPDEFQLVGGDETGESEYINTSIPQDAELIDKTKVEKATTRYKSRKIGQTAIFSLNDKLAA